MVLPKRQADMLPDGPRRLQGLMGLRFFTDQAGIARTEDFGPGSAIETSSGNGAKSRWEGCSDTRAFIISVSRSRPSGYTEDWIDPAALGNGVVSPVQATDDKSSLVTGCRFI